MEINKLNNIMAGQTSTDSAATSLKAAQDKGFEEKLKAAMEGNNDKELKDACKQFEGVLLNMVYKQMRATVNKSDLIQADPGREIFESMLDDSLVDKAAQTGTLGLADSLYKQLQKKKLDSQE